MKPSLVIGTVEFAKVVTAVASGPAPRSLPGSGNVNVLIDAVSELSELKV